ncbi:MAG: hypothetical protein HY453_01350 [Parcubacteria group bacterium]|nr:hypothetical protein [Parcubacteria group bacterium]
MVPNAELESSSEKKSQDALEREYVPEEVRTPRVERISSDDALAVKQQISFPRLRTKPKLTAPQKSAQVLEIESILEDELGPIFEALPSERRALFKSAGEDLANKLDRLIHKAKISAKTVFAMVRNWLILIPGVNRFFLEQEAKIMTDKILHMKKRIDQKSL